MSITGKGMGRNRWREWAACSRRCSQLAANGPQSRLWNRTLAGDLMAGSDGDELVNKEEWRSWRHGYVLAGSRCETIMHDPHEGHAALLLVIPRRAAITPGKQMAARTLPNPC